MFQPPAPGGQFSRSIDKLDICQFQKSSALERQRLGPNLAGPFVDPLACFARRRDPGLGSERDASRRVCEDREGLSPVSSTATGRTEGRAGTGPVATGWCCQLWLVLVSAMASVR